MLLARRISFILALLALSLLPVRPAGAQCVSLTTLGSAATQNFDTLSNTAGSTTNNLTIPGWFMTESGGGARDNEQYAVDTGGSTTGDTYSYGAAASTERALGQLRSGTLIPIFGACYTNNTGATITSLAVAYNGEEWRLGTAGADRPDELRVQPQRDGPGDRHLDQRRRPQLRHPGHRHDRGQERQRGGRPHGALLDDLRRSASPTARPSGSAGTTPTPPAPTTAWRSTTSR